MNTWLNFLIDSLAFGATFIYGSTGEILTEKAGHLNLGIPGIMCMGGAGGCLMLNMIGKSGLPPVLIVVLGILSALVFSMLMGLIYSFLTVTLRANQNVTGLALTTFGVGLMKVIMSKLTATVYLVGPKQYYRWPFAGRQDTCSAWACCSSWPSSSPSRRVGCCSARKWGCICGPWVKTPPPPTPWAST